MESEVTFFKKSANLFRSADPSLHSAHVTKPLAIVFCGTPAFAVPALETLAADPAFVITGVITQPDRPVGRKQLLQATDVKAAALKLGLPVEQPEKLNQALAALQDRFGQPDFLVVVAYGQILSKAALAWPAIMPINVHGSLLPQWRGASPVEHAILAGDNETGVTIQKMAEKLDAGDMLSSVRLPIGPNDTSIDLRERLSKMGADLLANTLKSLPEPVPQDDALATFCRTLKREDGRVNPAAMTADEIHRRWRAFQPWPGVFLTLDGEDVKVLSCSLAAEPDSSPLPCRDGTILFLQIVQPAGKRAMAAADWARGRR